MGAFDPADQFTNLLAGNDDFPSIGLSGFAFALTAGLTYFTVNSGFSNDDFGTYTMRISGPGDIIPGDNAPVIPEPATWAMMIAGFGLVGAAARRRSVVSATA